VIENVNSPLTGISVFDPDAGSDPIQVDLVVASGSLSATAVNVTVSGSGTTHLILGGSQVNINALLASGQVFYYGGTTTLTMDTNDLGHNGTPLQVFTDHDESSLSATTGLPPLSVNDVTLVEGNAGTTNAVFTVTLSASPTPNATSILKGPSQQPVTVNYATADGTATSGSDYTPTSGQLAFNAGETSKTVAVAVIGDTIEESDETFFLNLSNPTNATLSDAQGQGTIVNDDSPVPIPTLGGWATGLLMMLTVALALVQLGRARTFLS